MKDFYKMVGFTAKEEGFRSSPYLDSVGVWTIGYGSTYLLSGSRWKQVTNKTQTISKKIAWYHLVCGIHKAHKAAKQFVNNFDTLSTVRQSVLTMMAYQLGGTGLNKFKQTKKLIENDKHKDAAIEMLDSLWSQQTPRRAQATSQIYYSDGWSL